MTLDPKYTENHAPGKHMFTHVEGDTYACPCGEVRQFVLGCPCACHRGVFGFHGDDVCQCGARP